MRLTDVLDLADKALDLAQNVPGLGGAARIADTALGVAREGIAMLAPGDAKTVEARYAEVEARVAAHHERTIAALKAAERR